MCYFSEKVHIISGGGPQFPACGHNIARVGPRVQSSRVPFHFPPPPSSLSNFWGKLGASLPGKKSTVLHRSHPAARKLGERNFLHAYCICVPASLLSNWNKDAEGKNLPIPNLVPIGWAQNFSGFVESLPLLI